jgi:hypothetical protein
LSPIARHPKFDDDWFPHNKRTLCEPIGDPEKQGGQNQPADKRGGHESPQVVQVGKDDPRPGPKAGSGIVPQEQQFQQAGRNQATSGDNLL